MFNPGTEYTVRPEIIAVEDFHKYTEDYVVRPPYQRKTVWSRQKQQALLDSLFRRYYVPRLVIREVRLGDDDTKQEIIDGQQRISTVQAFFADRLPLPKTLADIHPDLPGKRYSELSADLRRFIDKHLKYDADIVSGIDNPRDPQHQKTATEIFWRLQQGEGLTYMEIAHARLSSLVRNFVVKHADDITFDYETYAPRDDNPDKHAFFDVVHRKNNRMQHLALLVRLLLFEKANGPADITNTQIGAYVDAHQVPGGIDNLSFEETPVARRTLSAMSAFYDVFSADPAHGDGSPLPELRDEYVILSLYLLIRHLNNHYVFDAAERTLVLAFTHDFLQRRQSARDAQGDRDLLVFSDNRQQTETAISVRDRIMRQHFFRFAGESGHEMLSKDSRRGFSETERIAIYRRDEGQCQVCLKEGKSEIEAQVPWGEYEADHVLPHSRGGATDPSNGQVLCRYHNRSKGAKVSEPA